ncbi:hypothetical protein D3C84_988750 [compost metagenome]
MYGRKMRTKQKPQDEKKVERITRQDWLVHFRLAVTHDTLAETDKTRLTIMCLLIEYNGRNFIKCFVSKLFACVVDKGGAFIAPPALLSSCKLTQDQSCVH